MIYEKIKRDNFVKLRSGGVLIKMKEARKTDGQTRRTRVSEKKKERGGEEKEKCLTVFVLRESNIFGEKIYDFDL